MEQILVAVSREGVNLAPGGTSLDDTITAINISAHPLNLQANGWVIVTAAYRQPNAALRVADHRKALELPLASSVGNTNGGSAILPAPSAAIPPSAQTLHVVQVTHRYTPITPLG